MFSKLIAIAPLLVAITQSCSDVNATNHVNQTVLATNRTILQTSMKPTHAPTTASPTLKPTQEPTKKPSQQPTEYPTSAPTIDPMELLDVCTNSKEFETGGLSPAEFNTKLEDGSLNITCKLDNQAYQVTKLLHQSSAKASLIFEANHIKDLKLFTRLNPKNLTEAQRLHLFHPVVLKVKRNNHVDPDVNERTFNSWKREITIRQKMTNPENVLELLDYAPKNVTQRKDIDVNNLVLVLEYMELGSLQDLSETNQAVDFFNSPMKFLVKSEISSTPQKYTSQMIRDVAQAMSQINGQHIIHGGISMSNIFVKIVDKTPKHLELKFIIGDWELAQDIDQFDTDNTDDVAFVGPAYLTSPELHQLHRTRGFNAKHGTKVDISLVVDDNNTRIATSIDAYGTVMSMCLSFLFLLFFLSVLFFLCF